jgi:hypothetical protein
MSEQNGWHPWLRPMQMQGSSNSSAKDVPLMLKLLALLVKPGLFLMLPLLAWLLAGCAAISTPSSEPARNPSMPQPSQSQPSVPYSQIAADVIKSWRKSLTDTLATP